MKTAVLINDSKFENLILQDMLSKLGYDVEMATEYDALYEIGQFAPDLVIVNYIMKETTGDLLIELIKAELPKVKCLLSSSSRIKKEDFSDHVDGILRIPASMFTLQDVLRKIGQLGELDLELPTHHQNHDQEEKGSSTSGKKTEPMTNEIIRDGRFCSGCDKDLSMFGEMIIFCPFCGEDISGN
ncbi:MAG: response regulator [Vallitaleaceae bacterium]|jgi:CheY-like chemotaxis protein|nr:response regulator [Vallitaleaceae bacterium]